MRDGTVDLPDGRRLGYREVGDGPAVVLHFHGTPSGRHLGLRTTVPGVRVLTVERPGVGLSTRKPGRRIHEWPDDVSAFADALGLDRFGVVGTSAGGPYALACGARLAARVTAVALRSSVGQRFDRPDLDEHQSPDLQWLLPLVRDDPALAEQTMPELSHLRAKAWRDDPAAFWTAFLDELDPADRADAEANAEDERGALEAAFADPDGYADEITAAVLPWGFDPGEVRVPVRAWHSAGDAVAPLPVLRAAVEVADGTVVVMQGSGHTPPPAWDDEIVAWLQEQA